MPKDDQREKCKKGKYKLKEGTHKQEVRRKKMKIKRNILPKSSTLLTYPVVTTSRETNLENVNVKGFLPARVHAQQTKLCTKHGLY